MTMSLFTHRPSGSPRQGGAARQLQPAFPLGSTLIILTVAAFVLWGLAMLVLPLVFGSELSILASGLFAAILVWVMAVVCVVLVAIAGPHGLMPAVYAWFLAMGLRLAVCLGAAVLANKFGLVRGRVLLVSLVLMYVPMLLMETGIVGRYLWKKDFLGKPAIPKARDTHAEVTA